MNSPLPGAFQISADDEHKPELIGYRVYLFGSDGQIAAAKEFLCENDDEAEKQAKQHARGCDVELWRRERFIVKIADD